MPFSVSDRDLDVSKWKVADLKKELKLRGLSAEGKKNDLVVRLQLAIGGSSLLDDTVNDQDELLDEDVLSDEEVDALEESDLIKSDTPENVPERGDLSSAGLKRKASDGNESQKQPSKKIILNRNVVTINKEANKLDGKENKTQSQVTEKTNIVKVGSLTQQERLERRAAKFGVAMSNEAKKEARAARFGLTTSGAKVGGTVGTNIEVLKKRAERFGTTLPGSILEKAENEERRKKREERFGKVEVMKPTTTTTTTTSFRAKPDTRTSIAEQKKQRAERFKIKL